MRLKVQRRQHRPGTTIVETTFVSLVCFVFMFAIFEYGRYVWARQLMENAARSGARVAVVTATSYISPAAATAGVESAMTQALANLPLQNVVYTEYQADTNGNNIGPWTQTPFGNNIVVQIDADLQLMFPTFGFLPNNGAATNSIHITTTVMMRGEAN
jgi:Flp pilus assembly protein TadG